MACAIGCSYQNVYQNVGFLHFISKPTILKTGLKAHFYILVWQLTADGIDGY